MSYPALTASPPRCARPVFPWRSGLAKKNKNKHKAFKKKPCTFYKKNIQGNLRLQAATFITAGLFYFLKTLVFRKLFQSNVQLYG